MSYKYIVAKNYNTRADFLTDLFAILTDMGWELHDDQSASSYKVYKSNGELGDRIYEYIQIKYATAGYTDFYAYGWWDATTHTGSCQTAYDYTNGYRFGRLSTPDTGFTAWIYGNKNLVVIMTKAGTSYYFAVFGHVNKKFLTVETILTANATAGTNATITVANTTGFEAGSYYQIFGSQGEGRDWVLVSSIIDSTHMVIANLPRAYNASARIGQVPSIFIIYENASTSGYSVSARYRMTCHKNASGTEGASRYNGINIGSIIDGSYVDPNKRDNDYYYLRPLLFYEFNDYISPYDYISPLAYNDEYILAPPLGTTEDVFYVGQKDSGTATGGDATTLSDTTKNWTTDQFANKVVIIINGTGIGQTRKILSNTATTLTVDRAWTTIPDSTSQYVIADECYRYVANGWVCKESC